MAVFVQLGIYDSSFRSGEPKVFFPPDDVGKLVNGSTVQYAQEFGFHTTLLSDFKIDSDLHRENRTRGGGAAPLGRRSTHQVMISNFLCSFEMPGRIKLGLGLNATMSPDISKVFLLAMKGRQRRLVPNEDVIADIFAKKMRHLWPRLQQKD